MSTEESEPIVKRGTFAYGDTVRHTVVIVQTDARFGSHDYEDPDEIKEDAFGTFYNIRYIIQPESTYSSTRISGFDSIEAAMHYIETTACDVQWS